MLADLEQTLRASRIEPQFAEVKDPVKDKLKRFGLLDQIGTNAFHPTIGTAVDACLAEHTRGLETLSSPIGCLFSRADGFPKISL